MARSGHFCHITKWYANAGRNLSSHPAILSLPEIENPEIATMPRGGSKKGEHRGEAKRQAKRKSGPPKGVSGNPDGRPKGSQNRATRERLAIIGAEIGIAELNGVMPKEIMLSIARTFMQMALNEQAKMVELQSQKGVENQVDALIGAYERHLVLAADTAYKAGAYYHPRLQALVVGNAQDKSPGDILRSMLDEIDDESRVERQQSRQIEHKPDSEDVVDLELRKAKGG